MTFEPIVMQYLASQGLFLSPQFSIRANSREWSCPDFVALDFRIPEVQVVEVSVAYDIEGLIQKIRDRENQWYQKLRTHLFELCVPSRVDDRDWQYVVHVFIRGDRKVRISEEFFDQPDVRIRSIEEIAFGWQWPWDEWARSAADR